MKDAPTQLDMRENTASSRRHASRLEVDSLPSMSNVLLKDLQHRLPTPPAASRTTETDKSFITIPLEATTGGERGESVEVFSAPSKVINANKSRQMTVNLEPFVSADEAAQFLCVRRRYLLELAQIRQSPLKRGIWLISEDHSRKYVARKGKSGCCGIGLRIQPARGSRTSCPSDLSRNFRRTRMHGARQIGSDFPSESMIAPYPAASVLIFLQSIILEPISAWMPCARNRLIPSATSSKSCAPISSRVSETKSQKTSSRSIFNGG